MNKTILLALILGLTLLSFKGPMEYEQITFDYFISDVLGNDFKNISAIEFKGKTETTYSTLGDYKFCLKPEDKLQSLVKAVTKESTRIPKQVRHEQTKGITITDFREDTITPQLYLYPAVRVADNFYVFLSFHKPSEPFANYVFELNVEGKILRSCKMN